MIEVNSMAYGWIHFVLKDNNSEMRFNVSYLSDFRDEIDYLLGTGDKDHYYDYDNLDMESRAVDLDGEGTLLKLSIMKHRFEDEICFTWWQDNRIPVTMVLNYDYVIKKWEQWKKETKDDYEKHFLMLMEDENEEYE